MNELGGGFKRSDTLALSLFSQGRGLLPWIILDSPPPTGCMQCSCRTMGAQFQPVLIRYTGESAYPDAHIPSIL